jgi:predicted nucleotidyltransferase
MNTPNTSTAPVLDRVIQILRTLKPYLHEQWGVTRLAVFGSVARGEADLSSDVDLVVEFDRPIGLRFVELCDYLEECLGRKVDVLTLTGVQHIRNSDVSRSILENLVYV